MQNYYYPTFCWYNRACVKKSAHYADLFPKLLYYLLYAIIHHQNYCVK